MPQSNEDKLCTDRTKPVKMLMEEDAPSRPGSAASRRSEPTSTAQMERLSLQDMPASAEAKMTVSTAFESQSGQGDFHSLVDAMPKCDDHSSMAMSRDAAINVSKDRPCTAAPSGGIGSLCGPGEVPGITTLRTSGFPAKDKHPASSSAQRIVFISTVKSTEHAKDLTSGHGDQTSSGGFPFFKLTTVSAPVVSQIAKPFYVVQRQGQISRASTFSATNPSTILTPGRSLIANCSNKTHGDPASQPPMDTLMASSVHQKPIITLHLTQNTGGAPSGGSGGGGGLGKFPGGPTYTISVEQAKMEGDVMQRHNTAANVLPGKASLLALFQPYCVHTTCTYLGFACDSMSSL